MADDVFELNVTLLPPKLKHPTIFERFDMLQAGEAFVILNDHDPKPLYYQLIAERGNIFSWTYLEQGPAWWKVQIKKFATEKGETIGQIAAKDTRKAEVFRKYGIDFCCGGKKSLEEVCESKGLNLSAIEAELNGSNAAPSNAPLMNFDSWDVDFLADYIYNQHHKYYYTEEPVITGLVNKVADHHGGADNSLLGLRSTYNVLTRELHTHFMKEERVVFPFIKALVQAKKTGDTGLLQQMSLTEPLRIMESDHEAAGDILEEIRTLTNNYAPPANACNSYQFMLKKLKELDEDLHQHIHLENNILFPKALALEKELRN